MDNTPCEIRAITWKRGNRLRGCRERGFESRIVHWQHERVAKRLGCAAFLEREMRQSFLTPCGTQKSMLWVSEEVIGGGCNSHLSTGFIWSFDGLPDNAHEAHDPNRREATYVGLMRAIRRPRTKRVAHWLARSAVERGGKQFDSAPFHMVLRNPTFVRAKGYPNAENPFYNLQGYY